MKKIYLILLSGFLIQSCGSNNTVENPTNIKKDKESMKLKESKELIRDEHTQSNYKAVCTKHIDLQLAVDFETKTLSGIAKHTIENKAGVDQVVFDTKYLAIEKVMLNDTVEAVFSLGAFDELLGTPLAVNINDETETVAIYYSTTAQTEALDWLVAEQTANKTSPFMYTQGQSIFTRSWIPLQDSPELRITYSADIKVPEGMLAVMSANNPVEKNVDNSYHFEMKQSIPCYLLALAVGELEFKALDARTGVYAEPSMLNSCAEELVDMGRMVDEAEELYGPYQWERFDVIVLPPSFPFGGMENPRLTFATPTIIAGDKSLVSLIAHELAHSWSGNLVTNATWNDFWLNEGFTVYFERRIMEAIEGKDYADMLALLGYQDLERSLGELRPEFQKLRLNLTGFHPDDAMTDIAYEKGYFFLRLLEDQVGRETFDQFLKTYFDEHKFQTITTDQFLTYLDKELLKPNQVALNIEEWVDKPGLPQNCPKVVAVRFQNVEQQLANYKEHFDVSILKTEDWSTHEWLHFLRHLDSTLTIAQFEELDRAFDLTNSGNSEIAAIWFEKSIYANYRGIDNALKTFLGRVGRRKFLKPLYEALASTPEGLERGRAIFAVSKPNYHYVSINTIEQILQLK
ncbi:MAG: M1 family metallopeptidase [Flavobacteriales bacterium]|jgi:aminopeptidase N|nr:M1 family metallopeptidase [Flavobacteriales bacterium]